MVAGMDIVGNLHAEAATVQGAASEPCHPSQGAPHGWPSRVMPLNQSCAQVHLVVAPSVAPGVWEALGSLCKKVGGQLGSQVAMAGERMWGFHGIYWVRILFGGFECAFHLSEAEPGVSPPDPLYAPSPLAEDAQQLFPLLPTRNHQSRWP